MIETIFQYATRNPQYFCSTFLLVVIVVSITFSTIFKCWSRFMRMLNIRKNGWPPPHCDADGDPVKQSDKSRNENA